MELLSEAVVPQESRTSWFTQARFGLFIHVGLYSIPAGVWRGQRMGRNDYAEWIQMQGNWPKGIPQAEYAALAEQFSPERFDADEWASIAADAGMKYVVLTSKHHDGFALWPSKVSRFNVVDATPFKRDLVGELSMACRKRGLRFCCYYSHWLDWAHPFGGRPHASEFFSEPRWPQPSDAEFEMYWQEKCLPQVRELLDSYHPSMLWFDTWASNSTPWINQRRIDELVGLIRRKDPNCLINSRIGTWGHEKGSAIVDFVSMLDNEFPKTGFSQPWETSGTMNRSWGHHQLDFDWQSSRDLIGYLIGNVSRGGNYQLNVGPMANGSLPGAAVRRLKEIGAWMTVNGEAITGVDRICFEEQTWGLMTQRTLNDQKKRIYLHLIHPTRPESIAVNLPEELKIAAVRVLETGEPHTWDGNRIMLSKNVREEPGIPVLAVECAAS